MEMVMNQSLQSRLNDGLIKLLHEHDHEPDEITKYVVIDQTEFVPEATEAILALFEELVGDTEQKPERGDKPAQLFIAQCEYINTRNGLRSELKDKIREK
jgi:hypothetical protein